MESTIDVKRFERRVRALADGGELDWELTLCAIEMAVACNVLHLSPMGRLMRGSDIHNRMRLRLVMLDRRISQLEAERAEQLEAAAA